MTNVLQEKTSECTTPALPNTTFNIDLEAYFRRIGYIGNHSATLDTLKAIHALHPQAIPFENLNPLLRIPVRLDIESLQKKLVLGGRGGYCFEHNLLLSQVLKTLGFEVKWLAGSVLWNVPEGVTNIRSHMVLLVKLNGESFIADTSFGGLTLTSPLRLEPNIEQITSHEPFRLIPEGEEFILQGLVQQVWKPIYRFGLQEQLLADYEATSWYLCNYPESHFIKWLMVARTMPDCRYALRNNELATHYLGGPTEKRVLTNANELRQVLVDIFGITLPDSQDLETTLQRVIQQPG